jgi:hypothetical protein
MFRSGKSRIKKLEIFGIVFFVLVAVLIGLFIFTIFTSKSPSQKNNSSAAKELEKYQEELLSSEGYVLESQISNLNEDQKKCEVIDGLKIYKKSTITLKIIDIDLLKNNELQDTLKYYLDGSIPYDQGEGGGVKNAFKSSCVDLQNYLIDQHTEINVDTKFEQFRSELQQEFRDGFNRAVIKIIGKKGNKYYHISKDIEIDQSVYEEIKVFCEQTKPNDFNNCVAESYGREEIIGKGRSEAIDIIKKL